MDILDELTEAIQDFYLNHGFNPEKIELSSKKAQLFKDGLRQTMKGNVFWEDLWLDKNKKEIPLAGGRFRGIPIEENANVSDIILKIPIQHTHCYLGEWIQYPKPNIHGLFDKVFTTPPVTWKRWNPYGNPFEYGVMPCKTLTIDEIRLRHTLCAYEKGWCL